MSSLCIGNNNNYPAKKDLIFVTLRIKIMMVGGGVVVSALPSNDGLNYQLLSVQ